jgi:hypothetical protein
MFVCALNSLTPKYSLGHLVCDSVFIGYKMFWHYTQPGSSKRYDLQEKELHLLVS